jgi:hypothetical protein
VNPSGRRIIALLDLAQKEKVLAYCKIAEVSGALLTLKDLVELLAIDASEEELEESISSDELLSSKVFVESGLVLLRHPGSDRGRAKEAAEKEDERRRRAIANLEAAKGFARLLSKDTVFVAVAGTNSYLSAAVNDDIDFYCITKTDGMWVFMLMSLVLSRVFSTLRRLTPQFDFSFVMDEKTAKEELMIPKGALYARDTLNARVISGSDAYRTILENASWMRSFFPTLYERRSAEVGSREGRHLSGKKGSKVVNMWLFLTLGSYVALRAWILNRKLAKQGRTDAIFKTWIGPGRLEYESRRYVELGKLYQGLEKR